MKASSVVSVTKRENTGSCTVWQTVGKGNKENLRRQQIINWSKHEGVIVNSSVTHALKMSLVHCKAKSKGYRIKKLFFNLGVVI